MGCVASKADLSELQPNLFRVWNVDDSGRPVTPGHLEVTETDLVLHNRGREPIRWPMRCLRRYGFDAELFSFESGRRCLTGAGIYAFKCRRAEELFKLLQEQIQASGQDEQSHGSGTGSFSVGRSASLSEAGYLEPIGRTRAIPRALPLNLPNSLSNSSTGLLSPTTRTGSPHYMNDDPRASTPPALAPLHEYVNSSAIESTASLDGPLTDLVTVKGGNGCRLTRSSDDNYARLDDLLKQEHSAKQRLYVNVKPDEKPNGSPPLLQDPYYANVKMSPLGPSIHPLPGPVRQVNYVVLDLDQPGDTCVSPNSPLSEISLPESPSKRTEGPYVTIDFDRTAALSNSTNPGPDKEESQRKTRHNSTIPELILSRHNSAVSE